MHARFIFQRRHQIGRYAINQLYFAGQQGGDAPGGLRDRTPGDGIDGGLAAPVIRIGLHHHFFIGNKCGEGIRAGTHRFAGKFRSTDFGDIRRWHNIGRVATHAGWQQRVGAGGVDFHLIIAGNFHGFDGADIRNGRRVIRRIQNTVDREFHRLRIDRLAVAELHTLTQGELPGGIIG